MNRTTNQTCPCCNSTNHSIRFEFNARQAALHISGKSDTNKILKLTGIINSIWGEDSASWYVCKNCQFEFAYPFIAGTAEFYQTAYSEENYYEKWRWEYGITRNSIKKYLSDDIQLLEIGAGNGTFVGMILPDGLSKNNILCTEYSEYGRNVMLSNGITCMPDSIYDLLNSKNEARFHVICMFQVLEHMDKLDEVFEALNFLSASKCDLYIAVPNHRHRRLYDSFGMFLDLPPIHISRFNPSSIKTLAARHGWELHKNLYQPTDHKKQTLMFIAERLERNSVLKKVSLVSSGKRLNRFFYIFSLFLVSVFNVLDIVRLNIGKKGVAQWFWLRKSG